MTTRYLTTTELKAYVRTEITSADDSAYDAAINTAETLIDNATGRQFIVASATTARSFRPSNGSIQLINDCTAITSVVDNGTTLVVNTDYVAEPLNNLSDISATVPYYALRRLGYYNRRWYNWNGIPGSPTIVVTATWGWAAIPPQIKEICKIIAKDVFLQRDVSHGLIGVSEAGGVGTRENRLVRETIEAYTHPASIGIG